MSNYQRPIPVAAPVSRPFWDGCQSHQLLFQECEECGEAVFPPQPWCPMDLSSSLNWRPSDGNGQVYSFSVVERPQTPAFDVPYTVAIVRLDEGFLMISSIVDCPSTEVVTGMRVEVVFDEVADGFLLPNFRPRSTNGVTR